MMDERRWTHSTCPICDPQQFGVVLEPEEHERIKGPDHRCTTVTTVPLARAEAAESGLEAVREWARRVEDGEDTPLSEYTDEGMVDGARWAARYVLDLLDRASTKETR